MDFTKQMHLALDQAKKSEKEVPVGAVVIDAAGNVIGLGHNKREQHSDASSHAEIEAIRAAGEKLGDWRLTDCTLVVTLEPCVMCAGAIVAARVSRVVFGAWDRRVGAAGSLYDILRDARLGKPVEVIGGIVEADCSALLNSFFFTQREQPER